MQEILVDQEQVYEGMHHAHPELDGMWVVTAYRCQEPVTEKWYARCTKTQAPNHGLISVRNVAWFAIAMIGSIALPGAARSGQEAEDRTADAIVRGPLGTGLDEYLTRGSRFGFSGAVLVVKDGAVVLRKGYGLADRAQRTPNSSATLFDVGSLAKPFTAAAILCLEEQGKLSTQDRIDRHLLAVPPGKAAITIHHLLTHTSGLASQGPAPRVDPTDRNDVVRALLTPPAEAPAGARFRYNNVNYFLLAAVVERASGLSFESYLKSNVFRRAGMGQTGFARGSDIPASRSARGYTMTGLDAGPAQILPYHWLFRGATGLLSSVEDLERWDRALRGEAVLTAASRRKMFHPGPDAYGYGWQIGRSPRGTPAVGHDGSTFCFESAFVRFPEDRALVVVLCNGLGVTQPVKRDLVAALFDRPYTKPPRAIEIAGARLKAYEGIYDPPGRRKPFGLTVVGGELESSYFLPARIWYAPETETRFVAFDWVESKEYRLDFQVDPRGASRGFILHGPGADQVFMKRSRPTMGRDIEPGVAELMKLGRRLERDEARPDRPVITAFLDRTRVSDADLVHLEGLPQLANLQLFDTSISDAGLVHLRGLASLKALDLTRTSVTDAGLARLQELKNLEVLGLISDEITDAGLVHLKAMTGLKTLLLSGTRVTGAGLAHLKGLTALRVLYLSGPQVTDAGLEHLAALSSLEKLEISDTRLCGPGLAHLSGLAQLRELFLNRTSVTDAGLAHVAGLTRLRTLYLDGCRITDAGLAHVAGLTDLRTLWLARTDVTGAGLIRLRGLTKLQVLGLPSIKITDEGRASLRELRELRDLFLDGRWFTQGGIEELRRDRPGVKDPPTAGVGKKTSPRRSS
jgi:CubicO group peptidase (beta-lactamase class C family)